MTDRDAPVGEASDGGTVSDEGNNGWREPESLAQGENIRRVLVERVQEIQAQLGSHGLNEDGTFRYKLGEFEDWRQRAKGALKYTLRDLGHINAWLTEQRRTAVDLGCPYEDMTTDEIHQAIRDLVRELVARTFEDDETGGQ